MKFSVPEGATPIEHIEDLIPMGIVTYPDLCAVEAENILEAMSQYLSTRKGRDGAWLDEPFLRKVHREMFGQVWRWAGQFRHVELTVGCPPHRVEEEVGKLIGDFRYWHASIPKSMTLLECAIRLHHRLSWIHPFSNGNGRHARLIADIYLHSQHHALPDWPSDLTVAGAQRTRYLAALREADGHNFEGLLAFTQELIPHTP